MSARILVNLTAALFLLSGGTAWAEAEEDHGERVRRAVKRQGDSDSSPREITRRVSRVQEERREDHGPRGERGQMRGPRGQNPRGPMRPMAGRAQSTREHRGFADRGQGTRGRAMQGPRWQGRGMPSHVSGRRSGVPPWAQQARMRTAMQRRGGRSMSGSRPEWQVIAYRNGWRPGPTASQGRPSTRGPQRATRGPRRQGPPIHGPTGHLRITARTCVTSQDGVADRRDRVPQIRVPTAGRRVATATRPCVESQDVVADQGDRAPQIHVPSGPRRVAIQTCVKSRDGVMAQGEGEADRHLRRTPRTRLTIHYET